MTPSLDAAQRRFIRTEMAISTTLSAILPASAMWMFFKPFPLPFWGAEGFATFLVKNSIGMAVVMTLLMTLATRMRILKGGAPGVPWDRAEHRWLRFIPGPLPVRAVLYAACVVLVFVPVGLVAARLLLADPVERSAFVAFNVVYGGAIGFSLTPFILIGAMSDRRRPSAPKLARR